MHPDPRLPRAESQPHAAVIPFTRIPDAVLLDPRLTAVQLRIYAVIARRADREKASAFPSYATIAKDAHVSRTSAIAGVRALVSLGYLAKRPQETGQGDATSNLYTISGERDQMFAPPRPNPVSDAAVVQNLNHGSANPVPPVVQDLNQGGAKSAPEPDSKNQKQKNKTQVNRIARAPAYEASAAAAATNPELHSLFSDFQDNIGALTAMAKQVIGELAAEHNADRVRDAIQEAVIYEKRSLGYVRRVLHAWKRDGRAIERGFTSIVIESAADGQDAMESAADLCWLPPELISELPGGRPNPDHPVAKTWEAICEQLPHLGRFTRMVTPLRLIGNVLTIRVSDARTYSIFSETQRHLVEYAVRSVLGDGASLQLEMDGREAGAACAENGDANHALCYPTKWQITL